MKYLIINLLYITIAMFNLDESNAQTVYYPAGNKAYEKKDSIITFFYNDKPVRRIDLKNGTNTDLVKNEIDYLYTKEWNSEGTVEREYRYNELGLKSYCKYWEDNGRSGIKKGEYPIRYDKYGRKISSARYNDYGNIEYDGLNHFLYDDKQQLISIYEKVGNDTISESHNILDAQGRTSIYYTYHHQWNEVILYKEIEYPNDTTLVASYTIDYNAERQDKGYIYIIEDKWASPLCRNRLESRVDVKKEPLTKMNVEQIAELIRKIKVDEYENKPVWLNKYDLEYFPKKRIGKVSYTQNRNIFNWLHEYRYDEIGREIEQINYENDGDKVIQKIYYQSYNPNNYDF